MSDGTFSLHRFGPVALLLALLVRIYQWTIRPLIGGNCRFYPSCSDYAIEALAVHGALRGALLALWRILRCNPWVPGGYDPVPPSGAIPANDSRHLPGAYHRLLSGGLIVAVGTNCHVKTTRHHGHGHTLSQSKGSEIP